MKKVILPQELQDSVEIITINSNGSSNSASRHIYLLGTAHISKKSSEQAKELVEFVRPSVVFLELCDERSAILTQNNNGKDNFDSVTPRILIEKLVNGEINAFVAGK